MTRRFATALLLALTLAVTGASQAGAETLVWRYGNDQGLLAQDFEAQYDAYDSEGAADFSVPRRQRWSISVIRVPGVYQTTYQQVLITNVPTSLKGPAASVSARLYTDAGGRPGTEVPLPAFSVEDSYGTFTLTLSSPISLGTGRYWVRFQPRMDRLYGGWFWNTAWDFDGGWSVWRNPGDGYGTGFTDWTSVSQMTGTNSLSLEVQGDRFATKR